MIARDLAQAGVNLALAARSAEKLQTVADEIASLGVRAAAFPADLTQDADRQRLVQDVEASLGPIDILINNAGVEMNSRFVRKTPAEIEQIIVTNVIAPMQLTRAVLPGMLERRRGHIITMSSLAGKLGVPYGSVYGASKAAVFAWSAALRVELEGTGVSVSVVAPGYVSEVGIFAGHKTRAPRLLGESRPDDVVRGVRRALERDLAEVIVNPRPFWPIHVLYVIAPNLVVATMRRIGMLRFFERTYDKA